MIEINGKYSTAKVFTDDLDTSAEGQIRAMCDQSFTEGAKIRVMPDVHAGKGCTIGTTMTIGDQVVPNIVGVDIGCGMDTVLLREKRIDLPKLDSFIRESIPHGRETRKKPHRYSEGFRPEELRCWNSIDKRNFMESMGSLGGGNHFIEIDRCGGDLYLVIHTGSRGPGKKVAEYYQKIAYRRLGGKSQSEVPYELAYLTGEMLENYLHDMKLMQEYAAMNRQVIKSVILDGMKLHEEDWFTTVHNYIDLEHGILRKGAVSAQKGERLLIPLNMRDGSLICTGKGNPDWNYSAPHGAGRLFSRSDAKKSFTLSSFQKEMEGIFTTSVDEGTLDECPMAYKPVEEIITAIGDTVEIVKTLKPIYNFKSSEQKQKKRSR